VQSTGDLLSLPFSEMCLCKSIENIITEFESKNESVEVILSCEIVRAPINANNHMNTLLMNLLTNAVKHNLSSDRRIWVDVVNAEGGYEVIIADNGPGIPDKSKAALFDPNRRFGGVGIHQSKQIVEKFGGCISVHDRIEGLSSEGASFKIWLPKRNPSQVS
jgi:signal transduction histidine kinase